jgi:hypothetical protein
VPFTLTLYVGENAEHMSPVENGIEIDKNSKLEIPCGSGTALVNIKILQPSGVSLYNARKFFLVAQPSSSEHFHTISSCSSDPLVAVNHRLVITNGNELPPIYYNATKGKGNKMTLKVKLLNSNGQPVLDRPNLKLNFVLHYEDNTTVDQSVKQILEIASDSKLFVGETGEAIVRFRIINAVSRKHGNKRFKISVSADSLHNAARYNDVSFDYSPCIDVRTKVDQKARARRIANKKEDSPTDYPDQSHEPEIEVVEDNSGPANKKVKTNLSPLPVQFQGIPAFGSYAGSYNQFSFTGQPSFGGQTSYGVQPIFGGQPTYGGQTSYGGGNPVQQPPSLAANALAELVLAKMEQIRWRKVDNGLGGTAPDSKAEAGSGSGVMDGYEVSNPNSIIDELVEAAKNILKPPSYSSDSAFVDGCNTVASAGPLSARAHSMKHKL